MIYYLRISLSVVLLTTVGGIGLLKAQLVCPSDTTIMCYDPLEPQFTGDASGEGYNSIFFDDRNIQSCPDDIIIQRAWIGQIDSTSADTCLQLITVLADTTGLNLSDTLKIQYGCSGVISENIQSGLSLPCSYGIDSLSVSNLDIGCEQQVFQVNWLIGDQCQDTSFEVAQIVLIENVEVLPIAETNIITDTGDASGAIQILSECSDDEVSYNWSNGDSIPNPQNLSAGIYGVTITNSLGCEQSLSFVVGGGTVMDTSGMNMDTSGMNMDTSGMNMDTSGMNMDTSGMGMDTSGMNMDTSGMNMDTSGMNMDTSGMNMDTSGMNMDTSGMGMDTSGMNMDTSGMNMDTSGMNMDTSGMNMDTSGMNMDTSGMNMDTSGMNMDTSGMNMDTSGMNMDTSGMGMDTTGMNMDTSGMNMDTSGMNMDTSGMSMDTSGMEVGIDLDTVELDTIMTIGILDRDGNQFGFDSVYIVSSDGSKVGVRHSNLENQVEINVGQNLRSLTHICPIRSEDILNGLSTQDILRGQNIILGRSSGCIEDRLAGDVNANGNLSAADLVIIRNAILGRIDQFPIRLTWTYLKNNSLEESGVCVTISDIEKANARIDLTAIKLGDLQCME